MKKRHFFITFAGNKSGEMKKIFLLMALCLIAGSANAGSWKLKDALKGVIGDSTAVSGISSALGSLLTTDKITVAQMVGEWAYTEPAVTFKSDNLLKSAGGAAASATIVSKLTPIYDKVGFDKATLTISADSSFVLSTGKMTLKGTISDVTDSSSEANFVFRFTVGGKVKVAEADTYVTKSATGQMNVMFDVTKLITLMELAGQVSGNASVQSAVQLLKSYDGLCAGFALKQVDSGK